MNQRSGILAKLALPIASVAMLAALSAPANATVATLAWSGASFSNGNTYDGYITYEYAGSAVTGIDTVSIVVGAGGTPGFTFYYNAAGQTTNVAPPPATVVNDTANQVYAVQVLDGGGSHTATYPEFEGLGGLAALITTFTPADGYTSYSSNGGTGVDLSNPGTSVAYNGTYVAGTVVSPIPEPASFALLGLGLAGVTFLRRRA